MIFSVQGYSEFVGLEAVDVSAAIMSVLPEFEEGTYNFKRLIQIALHVPNIDVVNMIYDLSFVSQYTYKHIYLDEIYDILQLVDPSYDHKSSVVADIHSVLQLENIVGVSALLNDVKDTLQNVKPTHAIPDSLTHIKNFLYDNSGNSINETMSSLKAILGFVTYHTDVSNITNSLHRICDGSLNILKAISSTDSFIMQLTYGGSRSRAHVLESLRIALTNISNSDIASGINTITYIMNSVITSNQDPIKIKSILDDLDTILRKIENEEDRVSILTSLRYSFLRNIHIHDRHMPIKSLSHLNDLTNQLPIITNIMDLKVSENNSKYDAVNEGEFSSSIINDISNGNLSIGALTDLSNSFITSLLVDERHEAFHELSSHYSDLPNMIQVLGDIVVNGMNGFQAARVVKNVADIRMSLENIQEIIDSSLYNSTSISTRYEMMNGLLMIFSRFTTGDSDSNFSHVMNKLNVMYQKAISIHGNINGVFLGKLFENVSNIITFGHDDDAYNYDMYQNFQCIAEFSFSDYGTQITQISNIINTCITTKDGNDAKNSYDVLSDIFNIFTFTDNSKYTSNSAFSIIEMERANMLNDHPSSGSNLGPWSLNMKMSDEYYPCCIKSHNEYDVSYKLDINIEQGTSPSYQSLCFWLKLDYSSAYKMNPIIKFDGTSTNTYIFYILQMGSNYRAVLYTDGDTPLMWIVPNFSRYDFNHFVLQIASVGDRGGVYLYVNNILLTTLLEDYGTDHKINFSKMNLSTIDKPDEDTTKHSMFSGEISPIYNSNLILSPHYVNYLYTSTAPHFKRECSLCRFSELHNIVPVEHDHLCNKIDLNMNSFQRLDYVEINFPLNKFYNYSSMKQLFNSNHEISEDYVSDLSYIKTYTDINITHPTRDNHSNQYDEKTGGVKIFNLDVSDHYCSFIETNIVPAQIYRMLNADKTLSIGAWYRHESSEFFDGLVNEVVIFRIGSLNYTLYIDSSYNVTVNGKIYDIRKWNHYKIKFPEDSADNINFYINGSTYNDSTISVSPTNFPLYTLKLGGKNTHGYFCFLKITSGNISISTTTTVDYSDSGSPLHKVLYESDYMHKYSNSIVAIDGIIDSFKDNFGETISNAMNNKIVKDYENLVLTLRKTGENYNSILSNNDFMINDFYYISSQGNDYGEFMNDVFAGILTYYSYIHVFGHCYDSNIQNTHANYDNSMFAYQNRKEINETDYYSIRVYEDVDFINSDPKFDHIDKLTITNLAGQYRIHSNTFYTRIYTDSHDNTIYLCNGYDFVRYKNTYKPGYDASNNFFLDDEFKQLFISNTFDGNLNILYNDNYSVNVNISKKQTFSSSLYLTEDYYRVMRDTGNFNSNEHPVHQIPCVYNMTKECPKNNTPDNFVFITPTTNSGYYRYDKNTDGFYFDEYNTQTVTTEINFLYMLFRSNYNLTMEIHKNSHIFLDPDTNTEFENFKIENNELTMMGETLNLDTTVSMIKITFEINGGNLRVTLHNSDEYIDVNLNDHAEKFIKGHNKYLKIHEIKVQYPFKIYHSDAQYNHASLIGSEEKVSEITNHGDVKYLLSKMEITGSDRNRSLRFEYNYDGDLKNKLTPNKTFKIHEYGDIYNGFITIIYLERGNDNIYNDQLHIEIYSKSAVEYTATEAENVPMPDFDTEKMDGETMNKVMGLISEKSDDDLNIKSEFIDASFNLHLSTYYEHYKNISETLKNKVPQLHYYHIIKDENGEVIDLGFAGPLPHFDTVNEFETYLEIYNDIPEILDLKQHAFIFNDRYIINDLSTDANNYPHKLIYLYNNAVYSSERLFIENMKNLQLSNDVPNKHVTPKYMANSYNMQIPMPGWTDIQEWSNARFFFTYTHLYELCIYFKVDDDDTQLISYIKTVQDFFIGSLLPTIPTNNGTGWEAEGDMEIFTTLNRLLIDNIMDGNGTTTSLETNVLNKYSDFQNKYYLGDPNIKAPGVILPIVRSSDVVDITSLIGDIAGVINLMELYGDNFNGYFSAYQDSFLGPDGQPQYRFLSQTETILELFTEIYVGGVYAYSKKQYDSDNDVHIQVYNIWLDLYEPYGRNYQYLNGRGGFWWKSNVYARINGYAQPNYITEIYENPSSDTSYEEAWYNVLKHQQNNILTYFTEKTITDDYIKEFFNFPKRVRGMRHVAGDGFFNNNFLIADIEIPDIMLNYSDSQNHHIKYSDTWDWNDLTTYGLIFPFFISSFEEVFCIPCEFYEEEKNYHTFDRFTGHFVAPSSAGSPIKIYEIIASFLMSNLNEHVNKYFSTYEVFSAAMSLFKNNLYVNLFLELSPDNYSTMHDFDWGNVQHESIEIPEKYKSYMYANANPITINTEYNIYIFRDLSDLTPIARKINVNYENVYKILMIKSPEANFFMHEFRHIYNADDINNINNIGTIDYKADNENDFYKNGRYDQVNFVEFFHEIINSTDIYPPIMYYGSIKKMIKDHRKFYNYIRNHNFEDIDTIAHMHRHYSNTYEFPTYFKNYMDFTLKQHNLNTSDPSWIILHQKTVYASPTINNIPTPGIIKYGTPKIAPNCVNLDFIVSTEEIGTLSDNYVFSDSVEYDVIHAVDLPKDILDMITFEIS